MGKIIIKNMKFYAYHGVILAERELGQFFHIDLELYMDLRPAGKSDSLEDTIDYSNVFSLIRKINEDNKFQLIERLAENVADALLTNYPQLEKVKIAVRKPEAPINEEFEWVGVELVRCK